MRRRVVWKEHKSDILTRVTQDCKCKQQQKIKLSLSFLVFYAFFGPHKQMLQKRLSSQVKGRRLQVMNVEKLLFS